MSRPGLASSFARTLYRVQLPQAALELRIGQRHPKLDAFLREAKATSWVVLSPCNPGARLLDEASNARRLAALREELEAMGLRHFPALGIPAPGEPWPPEPSLLILDLAPQDAAGLARRFGQLAWVRGGLDRPAELVWSEASAQPPLRSSSESEKAGT